MTTTTTTDFSLDARAALVAGGMSEGNLNMIIARTGTDAAYVAAVYASGRHLQKVCDRVATPTLEELPLVLGAVRALLVELEAALALDVDRPIGRTFHSPGDLLGAVWLLRAFGVPLETLGRNTLEMARTAATGLLARHTC
jgi:hypothetical protein